ncbi:hypothetical protein J7L27_05055 [Candidatus Bathyarchaeota archaeon]|nr:hypothetical protein [Candidatus Bathyarchaeota archaeon]
MIDIRGYSKRLKCFKRNISKLRHGSLALKFLDHLATLGLSQGRLVKYAEHLPPLLRIIDFNPREAMYSGSGRVGLDILLGYAFSFDAHVSALDIIRVYALYTSLQACV